MNFPDLNPFYRNSIVAVLLCLQWLTANASNDYRYPLSEVTMSLQRVSEHVYFVQGATGIATDNEGFISNAAVIVTNQGVTVVDALGSPSLAEKLDALIDEITDLPVKRVIVTHYHADHIYGLQLFKDKEAEVLAPYGVDDYLGSQAAQDRLEERRFSLDPWVNENTRLVPPDRQIKQSQTLDDGGVKLHINLLGKAHSDADLTVLVEPDQVLISGDVIFEGRIPFVGDSDSKQWLETLNKLSEQDGIKALIPGHGGLATDPVAALQLTRDYLAFLRDQLGAGVEEMMTFAEIYSGIDWSQFEHLPAFEIGNRINAYQVFLSMEKELLEN